MSNLATFAFDRSARTYDAANRLHLSMTNISKAAVNPYFGREIPNWKILGLDENKIYKMFRDPAELAKAAPTFNNIPLLSKHVPVYAVDHHPELVVGSTGTDSEFDNTYLKNSLVVWAQDSIDRIEDNTQKELSSAYGYTAIMEPGNYAGETYEGRMTDIIGNHVALVDVGRAGPDVVVSDSNPFEETPMKFTKKQFDAKVKPLLAQDSALSFEDFIALSKVGVHVVKPCLAQDANIDDAELKTIVTSAAEFEVAQDAMALFGALSTEEKAKVKASLLASDAEPKDLDDEDEDDDKEEKVTKTAMDSAIKAASAVAEQKAAQRFSAVRRAEKEVSQLVGEVAAMDSAEEIYKFALDSAGVDTKDVHPSAYSALVKMAISQKSGTRVQNSTIAQDAASASSDFKAMFPNASVPARAF